MFYSRQVVFAMLSVVVIFAGSLDGEELQGPEGGKKIKVFLFAGQSNMEGRADGRALSEDDQRRLKGAQDRIQLAFNYGPATPLDVVAPSKEIGEIYDVDRIFGPELFFGIELAEAWPDERMLFIKFAAGASSLHGAWNPEWSESKAEATGESEAPRLYSEFIHYVERILGGYSPAEYEICALLWVQGETDSDIPEAAVGYGHNLRTLITRVRLDTEVEKLPFILFEVGSEQVMEGMKSCANSISGVHLIRQRKEVGSPDFFERMSKGHYDYAGMKKLGARFAKVYLRSHAAG